MNVWNWLKERPKLLKFLVGLTLAAAFFAARPLYGKA